MDLTTCLRLLQKIYALHADFCAPFEVACREGCAVCCTANVTLTTLEGRLILNHWRDSGQGPPWADLEAAARRPRFQPALTLNHMAALCLQGAPVPDEEADPEVGPCPLLENNRCSIYAARPLGCRAMVSRAVCAPGGAAEMPEEILAANHLCMQYIEALDAQGLSGNLVDVILFLSGTDTLTVGATAGKIVPPAALAANRTLPVLMIPPELHRRLLPLVQAIQKHLHAIAE
ncbi:MAG: YkgJ family cysteine cluster protein [Desulfatitalea sp.]